MEERSTVAGGLTLAALGALFFAGVGYWYFQKDLDNAKQVEIANAAKVAEAGAPFVSAEQKQERIFAEHQRLETDHAALKSKKPKTRDDVEKIIGRAPDACNDDGSGGTYCLWYYADKPENEPKSQIGVTFKGDKVSFVD